LNLIKVFSIEIKEKNMVPVSTLKKVATVRIECAKRAITLGSELEVGYKLTHGGIHDVSPW
jgi:hypothetical protein